MPGNSFYFDEASAFLSKIIQAQVLNLKVLKASHLSLTVELPYSKNLVGNPETGILHGGCIITLMDTTCGIAARNALDANEICPTLDLRVDYLRVARPNRPVQATIDCVRITDHVLLLRGTAYQDDIEIATCSASFMRIIGDMNMSIDSVSIINDIDVVDAAGIRDTSVQSSEDLLRVAEQTPDKILRAIPYANFIGMQLLNIEANGDICFVLNHQEANLGNPIFPAIHGGVIGGFMQLSASMHLMFSCSLKRLPKIIDFSIDYLRAGLAKDCFTQCSITRMGSRVAHVEITAWQEPKKTREATETESVTEIDTATKSASAIEKPIAIARCHFLLV